MMQKLYQAQREVLDQALAVPKHFFCAQIGLGARIIQTHLAKAREAVVIAPLALHREWEREFTGRLLTPQWVQAHPDAVWPHVVVDLLGDAMLQAVFDVIQKATTASVRRYYAVPHPMIKIVPFGLDGKDIEP